jgi:sugar lactone lactonase YvrE
VSRAFLLFCWLAAWASAADTEPRWLALNRVAGQAIRDKNYAKLRDTLLELKPLMPGNPRVVYNLAASEAKLGNQQTALRGLRDLSGAGLVYDIAADEDFASLRESGDYAVILKRFAENKKPVTHSSPAFQLAQRDLIPEDIAYDAKTQRFFVSSVRESKIITGDGKKFASSDWSVLALRVDAKRRILWAATGWLPHCEHCDKSDKDKTALLALDLDSGALKQRYDPPVKGLLGDMTMSSRGDIYVSEGIHGAVLHLAAGAGKLERLDVPGEFPSPQTPALSSDEKTLYVPDYVRGIAAIDLASRAVKWLEPAGNIALNGIDGLYVYGDSFLAVQNGTNPPRIMRFSLDLRKQELLEANTRELGEPTHGTLVGNLFYFLANTGWGEYDDEGKKKAGSAPVESWVRKISLTKSVP